MRGKRKYGHSKVKKENQTVRTRLLEISMKVDDCIYHKKTISEDEADIFMREVLSYKAGCSEDERSLQVIEKLVRCMKAIISEHQETKAKGSSNDDHPYLYNENHGASSPSYSLPDEDRTQLTQCQELVFVDTFRTHHTSGNENINTQNRKNIQSDLAAKTNAITEVIDLYDENQVFIAINSEKNYESNINTELNIHKALSNLSISAMNDDDVDDPGCSQSVLHNFQAVSEFEQSTSNLVTVDSFHHKVDINKNKTKDVVFNIQDRNNQVYDKHAVQVVSDPKEYINPTIISNIQCSPNILHNFKEIDKFQQIEPQNIPVLKKINTHNNIVTQIPIQNVERKISNEKVVKPTITQWNVKDTRAININNNQNDPLVAKVSKAIAINTTYIFGKPPNVMQTASFPNISAKEKENDINSINNTLQNHTPVQYNSTQDNSYFTVKEYITQNDIPKTVNNNKSIPRRGKKSNEKGIEDDTGTVKKKRAPRRKKNEETVKGITNTIDLTGTNQKITKTGSMRTYSKKKRYDKNSVLKEVPIPIYNRNVENDLSWLENIRFVREIGDDEHDRGLTNLSHDFWDNFDMPPIFDDNDFLCY